MAKDKFDLNKEDVKEILKETMKASNDKAYIQRPDENPFFSHHQTMSHDALKFYIDFTNISSIFGLPDDKGKATQTQVLTHKIIILDPFVVKGFFQVMASQIDSYEKKFGEITMKVEGNVKKEAKQNYFG